MNLDDESKGETPKKDGLPEKLTPKKRKEGGKTKMKRKKGRN